MFNRDHTILPSDGRKCLCRELGDERYCWFWIGLTAMVDLAWLLLICESVFSCIEFGDITLGRMAAAWICKLCVMDAYCAV